jgi:hypothetical protein
MGRPRKRQFTEVNRDEPTHDEHDGFQDPALLSFSAEDFDFDPVLLNATAETFYTASLPTVPAPDDTQDLTSTKTDDGRVIWHFGTSQIMAGPPINFGDAQFGGQIPPIEPVPQLSTASTTDSESSPPQSTTLPAPCSCLASMYLALASLQQFPTDIVPALATVRGAAQTAAASIWCSQCGAVMLDDPTPPIESFQNTMLLGTILPIIANGYGRLLKMIDAETDLAVALGQTKTFRFQDYGGLSGAQETLKPNMQCMGEEIWCNAVEMPPAQWRTTVRALLRIDIYGHEQPGLAPHKGLKDLVSAMEFRQRTRHDMIDAQIASGTLDPDKIGHGFFAGQGDNRCLGEKTRGCLEILKMAKVAIDSLVIA